MSNLFTCPHCHLSLTMKSSDWPLVCRCGACHKSATDLGERKSRGLGDTIAKFTRVLGINPCGGCGQRQEFLNKMFPYSPEYLAEQAKQDKRASNG